MEQATQSQECSLLGQRGSTRLKKPKWPWKSHCWKCRAKELSLVLFEERACCFFVTVRTTNAFLLKTKATEKHSFSLCNAILAILDNSVVFCFQYIFRNYIFPRAPGCFYFVLICFFGDFWVKLCLWSEVKRKYNWDRRGRRLEQRKRRKLEQGAKAWPPMIVVLWISYGTQNILWPRLQLN